MELMQASNQWYSRPDDERFTSLSDMQSHFERIREQSRQHVVPSRSLIAIPSQTDHKGLTFEVRDNRTSDVVECAPTNYSFGQLATLAEAPPSYLRTLPAPIAADAINYGLQFKRAQEDVGVLTQHNGDDMLRAATGPRYGRIWNADVTNGLVNKFGDGITGDFRVPGEFGKAVTVTKANTTLYASDRDMFVFLADEINRIEMPNRRHGQSGQMARGFFVWNSEVGDKTFGLGTFLFDYVCMNRIVWGAEHYAEVKIRHTSMAPDRFLGEMMPAIEAMRSASTFSITDSIAKAQAARIDGTDGALDEFLAKRFGKRLATPLKAVHEAEEGRPIETLWDASVAVTAYARSVPHQDKRVEMEREAGKLIKLAA